MQPYSAPTIATEKLFNYKISATRIVVERAFGILKTRWRYLLGKVMKPCPRNLAQAIVVCCMLQNMCLESGTAQADAQEDAMPGSKEAHDIAVDVPSIDIETTSSKPMDIPTEDALAIRDSLAKFLHPS
ncbi:hypothetical protein GOP47_0001113 [Adiantum capillus-veneris]|uniref:DDE Tnp4 domain-containing protein n=1 Tax=Adiantum capillus-veneris TaxID=13818 RepID=A0A9D4VEJ8_ADICA|nr:hypothetical protein GOP47_0001113 [Adiantum capillus-veneris]